MKKLIAIQLALALLASPAHALNLKQIYALSDEAVIQFSQQLHSVALGFAYYNNNLKGEGASKFFCLTESENRSLVEDRVWEIFATEVVRRESHYMAANTRELEILWHAFEQEFPCEGQ